MSTRHSCTDVGRPAAYRWQVARILVQVGEHARALDVLAQLVRVPAADINAAWLRLEPSMRPLRGNPRFERLNAN